MLPGVQVGGRREGTWLEGRQGIQKMQNACAKCKMRIGSGSRKRMGWGR